MQLQVEHSDERDDMDWSSSGFEVPLRALLVVMEPTFPPVSKLLLCWGFLRSDLEVVLCDNDVIAPRLSDIDKLLLAVSENIDSSSSSEKMVGEPLLPSNICT